MEFSCFERRTNSLRKLIYMFVKCFIDSFYHLSDTYRQISSTKRNNLKCLNKKVLRVGLDTELYILCNPVDIQLKF